MPPLPPAAPVLPVPSRRPSPSAEMGRLLLGGWTMLAECCDACAVPLMRDPGGDMNEVCVTCGRLFRGGEPLDGDGDGGGADGGAAAVEGGSADAGHGVGSTAASAGAAAAHGEAGADGASPSAAAAAPAAAPPANDPASARAPTAEGRAAGCLRSQREPGASDLAADLLSRHMLMGWALLEQACPLCSTPLMRERGTRQVYCVACDLPVGAALPPPPPAPAQQQQQAEAVPLRGPAATGAEAQPGAAPAAAARVEGPARVHGSTRTEVAVGGEQPAHVVPTQQPQAQPQPVQAHIGAAAPVPPPVPEAGGAGVPLSLAAALAGAQAALASKVREISSLVAATPASDAEALRSHTQLLTEVLRVLAAVRESLQSAAAAPATPR